MNETNWITQRASSSVTDTDRKALEKAQKQEKKLLKHGYRWVKINDKLKIFVECDKKGHPTEKGQHVIAETKRRMDAI